MVDKEKIILMTKLAINDKNYSKKDTRIVSHYKEDYIYFNNFKTRFLVFCVAGGFILVDVLAKVEKGLNIPATGEEIFIQYIKPYGIFLIGVLLFYTFISTVIYTKRYNEAQKRVRDYQNVLKKLDEYESNKSVVEGEKHDSRRANINYETKNYSNI